MQPISARLTPTIKAIVVILATMFLLFLFVPASHTFLRSLAIGPNLFREPWQVVTSLFVHFSVLQFIFSLIGLWFIGAYIEGALGRRKFLTLYLGSGIIANVAVGTVAWAVGVPAGEVACSLSILALFVAFGRLWGDQDTQVLPGLVFKARHISTFWVIFASVAALIQGALPYLVGVLVTAACGYVLAAPGSLRQVYDQFRSRRLRQRYKVLDGGAPKRGKPRKAQDDKYWN
jgi:membrane associated rhomboid family serine protease